MESTDRLKIREKAKNRPVSEDPERRALSYLPLLNALLSLVVVGAAAEIELPAFSPAVGAAFLNFLKLTAALTVFRSTFEVLESAWTHLSLLCSFMNRMTPVMQAVCLAEGSVTQAALTDIDRLAMDIEREANIETLVQSRGFTQCVAVLNEDQCSLVVESDGLMPGEAAQISEIVYEQAGILPENLKIIERNG